MAHQNQFGLFSYNRTIYDGDPYGAVPTKKIGCDAKRMGKQFVTSPIKRGKTADVYFSPKMVCDCPCEIMRLHANTTRGHTVGVTVVVVVSSGGSATVGNIVNAIGVEARRIGRTRIVS